MDPNTITFACYNIGQGFDFHNLVIRNGSHATDKSISSSYNEIKSNYDQAVKEFQKPSENGEAKNWWTHPDYNPPKASLEKLDPLRRELLKSIFDLMKKNCGVILLQEVVEEIDFVKSCFGENFDFSYKMSSEKDRGLIGDAVVIWNKEKFEKIKIAGKKEASQESDQRCKTRSAIVRLKDLSTNKIFDIGSLHAPGYNIKEPTEKNITLGEQAVELINKVFGLNKNNEANISIVSGDFNSDSNPTYYDSEKKSELATRRFKLLTNNGFKQIPHNQLTAYNPDLAKLGIDNGKCALDYAFVKQCGTDLADLEFLLEDDFRFPLENPSTNPSDHIPLFFKVAYKG